MAENTNTQDTKMKLSEWERDQGVVFYDVTQKELDTVVPRVQLEDMLAKIGSYTYITWDTRLEFLKENGYEATRENITNIDLPARKSEQFIAEAEEDEQA